MVLPTPVLETWHDRQSAPMDTKADLDPWAWLRTTHGLLLCLMLWAGAEEGVAVGDLKDLLPQAPREFAEQTAALTETMRDHAAMSGTSKQPAPSQRDQITGTTITMPCGGIYSHTAKRRCIKVRWRFLPMRQQKMVAHHNEWHHVVR